MKIMQTAIQISLSLATCLWLQSCSQQPEVTTLPTAAPSVNKITLSGSHTIGSILSEIAKPYETAHPGVKIEVQENATWRGIADVRQGTADIGMVARSMKADEKDLLAFTIAKDGISITLHRDNPVKSLTDKQIVGIYTGKIKNWKEVGGKNVPILVIHRSEGVAALEPFLSYFKLEKSAIRPDVVVTETDELVQAMVGKPQAIGFSSIGVVESIKEIKILPINGVAPTNENVSSGKFPITRPLNVVTKNPPSTSVKGFIDFSLSQEAQAIVKQKKFAPVK
ncbi:phosphate ABC transporter substrate-binding protein [Kamptonema sp. UHCC 0994]|uniref:phosphate ABC transporter substrate-binding protein n=1 Tax=Kamptonema sp. UHCC 0994 TaxID=3031329 RepID=UPI0023B89A25|nr:phosphate ABC transporter substrate-binding protein [Kamptonema sp. UHCC 0994]MDF0552266.1 phosphate ABC transporter substrate-binding protein [Kamptonema sp. UHCC 0994]